jgi:putative transposase
MGKIFYSLKEAQVLIEQWRVEYNTQRPDSGMLGTQFRSQEL